MFFCVQINSIGRDKWENIKSIHKCYKEMFETLSKHLNENLHNKLNRLRKEEGSYIDFSTFIDNYNFNKRM